MKYELRENYYTLYVSGYFGVHPEEAFAKMDEEDISIENIAPAKRGYKICRKCFKHLPVKHFYNKKNVKCKVCAREEAKERQRRNKLQNF